MNKIDCKHITSKSPCQHVKLKKMHELHIRCLEECIDELRGEISQLKSKVNDLQNKLNSPRARLLGKTST